MPQVLSLKCDRKGFGKTQRLTATEGEMKTMIVTSLVDAEMELRQREQTTAEALEYPEEIAACPYCKAEYKTHIHRTFPYGSPGEFEQNAKEIAAAINGLKEKYPKAMNYCSICGEKL
jgi:hypothetical protein